MKLHAYINSDNNFGKKIEKHLLFFTIIGTKFLYLLFSVLTLWLTEKMFHIGKKLAFFGTVNIRYSRCANEQCFPNYNSKG